MTPPTLRLHEIVHRYGKRTALDGLSFDVDRGSLTVLLGPAGAGKTTTLRCIAGLEQPREGRIILQGEDLTGLQPCERDVAMIFDSLALYPQLSGFDNIAHPLKVAGLPKLQVRHRVGEIARLLRIEHVLDRLPKTCSGGERQRIALGRAMVREPAIFLLDEPLSSLDAKLRLELRAELKRLQRDMQQTFLYATPDYAEALAIADVVVVLLGGKVHQIAPPQVVYEQPANRDVARFVGSPTINLVDARTLEGPTRGIAMGEAMELTMPPHLQPTLNGQPYQIGVRPEHVLVTPAGHERAGARGTVTDVEPLGLHAIVRVDIGGVELTAQVSGELDQAFERGDAVSVALVEHRLSAFDSETGQRIG